MATISIRINQEVKLEPKLASKNLKGKSFFGLIMELTRQLSLRGQTQIGSLQERFKSEYGLSLRDYDSRNFAAPDATIRQIRKKRGATNIDVLRNTKVVNVEDCFMKDFGIKV
jgi:hypothetical protein